MSQTLFSSIWYRVANLKPRIRNHVDINRHVYRGKEWYILSDRITGRYHRISKQAYHIVGLMDGQRSLQMIWDCACSRLKESMPTQDEILDLLSNLHRTDMLMADIPPDTADLHRRMVKENKTQFIQKIRSPMSVKIPLFDPDKILTFLKPLTDSLINKFTFFLWLVLVLSALVMAMVHLDELTENITDKILGMESIVLMWMVYPCVKFVHEIGHACCVKKWDGEVHDVGIMFLVLMPIPYVDASASICFADKRKRIVVDAAGIIIELFLASTALFLWLNIEPGIVRTICFNVMIIASISTLLFNGNPLLKFDAYYILSDAIEVPNLASKSNQFAGYFFKKYLLRVKDLQVVAGSIQEAIWLGVYSLLSFLYRIFISIRISLFVAGKFFIIGVLLAIWAGVNMLISPIIRTVKKMMNDNDLKGKRMLAFSLMLGFVLLTVFFLYKVPFPYSTLSEGVTQIQKKGVIYASADGVLTKLLVKPGSKVIKGTPLFELKNPEYKSLIKINRAKLKEYQAKLKQVGIGNPVKREIIKEEIIRNRKELNRIYEKLNGLIVKSPCKGIFHLPDGSNLIGKYYRQGMAVGYVIDFKKTTIQVVIHQVYADIVRQRTQDILVRFSGDLNKTVKGELKRQIPAASNRLPNMALSLEGGGDIALDPTQINDPKTFEKYFQFEIAVAPQYIKRIGERVFVKFVYEPEPLFYRQKRFVQRLLMSRFEI